MKQISFEGGNYFCCHVARGEACGTLSQIVELSILLTISQ